MDPLSTTTMGEGEFERTLRPFHICKYALGQAVDAHFVKIVYTYHERCAQYQAEVEDLFSISPMSEFAHR